MTDSVFDASALLELVGGDEELKREIIALYLAEYPRLLAGIRAAATSGDARALQFGAHALKGSVGNMAAPRAYAAAQELETLARADRIPDARAALLILEQEFARLADALNQRAPGVLLEPGSLANG